MNSKALGPIRALMLAAALGLAPLGAAHAQSAYSDAKLEAFVVAAIAVQDIVEVWVPRIRDADDETAADRLRQEAHAELVAAIEGTEGITVDEYRQINQAARTDPDLMARIEAIVRGQTDE